MKENNNHNQKPENEPLDSKCYISTRQAYDQAELEVSGRYDKWILTFSAGALGLSITFIDKIAKNPTLNTLPWLKFSWICLISSLLLALLSLLTSQSAIRENRNELDSAHAQQRAPRLSFPRCFSWTTNLLNWGSLLLFVLGTVLLCVFSFKSLGVNTINGKEQNVQKTTSTQKATEKRTFKGKN